MTKVMAVTSVIKLCDGLNVCVPPKIHMLDSSAQCDGALKWALWEVVSHWDFCPYKEGLERSVAPSTM